MEARRIQLHLGKCIEDLDNLHNVPDLKTKKVKLWVHPPLQQPLSLIRKFFSSNFGHYCRLCKTAQKLLESAEQAREKGDEEYSYVYYMKYLRVIGFISKDQDYQRHKKYYTDMLGPKNPNKAIDAAEKLKNSLIERLVWCLSG